MNIPPGIEIKSEGLEVEIFLALNYYISTGDYLGHGLGITQHGQLFCQIPVNQENPIDLDDWNKLVARIDQVRRQYGIHAVIEDHGRHNNFIVKTVAFPLSQLEEWMVRLIQEPGPLGWGSTYQSLWDHEMTVQQKAQKEGYDIEDAIKREKDRKGPAA
jgi:hypothetical protein